MNSYNLCDEPWIRVRYQDGRDTELGLTQLFQDADKIIDICPPVFRNESLYLYVFPVTRLLTTIISSAFFKENTQYVSANLDRLVDYLKENGLNNEYIVNYLNTYHDRFDLFSDTHPFLQNIALKELAQPEPYAYVYWNPFTPSANNMLFGKFRAVDTSKETAKDQFIMSAKEFAYFLIYMASMGGSPNGANYPENSLSKKASIFIRLKGSTLKDTLIGNLVSLSHSSHPNPDYPDTKPDMPVWELDHITDLDQYEISSLSKNILICSFYPGISFLCTDRDDNGDIKTLIRLNKALVEDETLLDNTYQTQINTKTLAEYWHDYSSILNSFTVAVQEGREQPKVNKSGKVQITGLYKDYNPNNTAFNACLSATEHLDAHRFACHILDNLVNDCFPKLTVQIFFRNLDSQKTTLLTHGIIESGDTETWIALRDSENHNIAVQYQGCYNKMNEEITSAINRLSFKLKHSSNAPIKTDLLAITSVQNNFSEWVRDDFFGQFTNDLEKDPETAFKLALDRLCCETKRLFGSFCDTKEKQGGDLIEILGARNIFNSKINKYKEKQLE